MAGEKDGEASRHKARAASDHLRHVQNMYPIIGMTDRLVYGPTVGPEQIQQPVPKANAEPQPAHGTKARAKKAQPAVLADEVTEARPENQAIWLRTEEDFIRHRQEIPPEGIPECGRMIFPDTDPESNWLAGLEEDAQFIGTNTGTKPPGCEKDD
ncbi:MAG: hypothetical protein Q9219_000828 [cf. Caloplaca sp. 3 TL-2023]